VVDARSQPPQPSDEVELVRSVVDLPRVEHVAAQPTVVAALWSCRLHAISAVAVGARSERVQNLRKPRKRSTVTRRRTRAWPVQWRWCLGAMLIPEGA
jgi:hypothetical protein